MTTQSGKTQRILFLYGTSFLMTLLLFIVSLILLPFTGMSSLILLYLFGIVLTASYSGLKGGLLTTTLFVVVIYYFYTALHLVNMHHFSSLLELIIFFFVGIVTSFIIEKLKNTEEVIIYKQRERDYLRLLSNFQNENGKYQKEIQARDEFLSIASHELKTPLSSMLLQLQAILHNIRNVSLANFSVEKLLKMLQSAEQQSVRLSKMINDLLNISLITTGRLELETESFDLKELTRDVVDRFNQKVNREGHQIQLEAKKSIIVKLDKLRIEQVITNLISNAIKYGKDKPIEVEIVQNNSVVTISVTDHGIGIPHELQKKIFEKFERAVSNHDYSGLGVGLYITAQIVKAHNGIIKLKSKTNSGSTFFVELPL